MKWVDCVEEELGKQEEPEEAREEKEEQLEDEFQEKKAEGQLR